MLIHVQLLFCGGDMGKFLAIVGIVAVAIFILTFAIMSFVYIGSQNSYRDDVTNYAYNDIFLRYYLENDSDGFSCLECSIVHDPLSYQIEIPEKDEYRFLGLFDIYTDVQYVDSDGRGMTPLPGDILLYAKYEYVG